MKKLATLFSALLLAGTANLALAGGDYCPSKGMKSKGEGYGHQCGGHHQKYHHDGPRHCAGMKGGKQAMADMTNEEREAFMQKRMAQKLDHRLVRMTYRLDLNEEQQKQMREILQNKQQQMQTIRKQTQEQMDKVLTKEQREKMQYKRPV